MCKMPAPLALISVTLRYRAELLVSSTGMFLSYACRTSALMSLEKLVRLFTIVKKMPFKIKMRLTMIREPHFFKKYVFSYFIIVIRRYLSLPKCLLATECEGSYLPK